MVIFSNMHGAAASSFQRSACTQLRGGISSSYGLSITTASAATTRMQRLAYTHGSLQPQRSVCGLAAAAAPASTFSLRICSSSSIQRLQLQDSRNSGASDSVQPQDRQPTYWLRQRYTAAEKQRELRKQQPQRCVRNQPDTGEYPAHSKARYQLPLRR